MGFTALYIIADFQPAEKNVNMKQRLAGTAPTPPSMLEVECHAKGKLTNPQ